VMAQEVHEDENRLQADVMKQQQMLKSESIRTQVLEARKYPDGCVCECKSSGCDEENHEGPVCKCPKEAHIGDKTSMPPPFEPWPFHQPGAARAGRWQNAPGQALYSVDRQPAFEQLQNQMPESWVAQNPKQQPVVVQPNSGNFQYIPNPRSRRPRQALYNGDRQQLQNQMPESWVGQGPKAAPVVVQHNSGNFQYIPNPGARRERARRQMKWVGSPQKMLPPDGDYPGGSTGTPLDGYLAYETGWANDGPFHGELPPMQEAGIVDKAQRPQSLRAMPQQPRQLVEARARRARYAAPRYAAPKKHKESERRVRAMRRALRGGTRLFGESFDEKVPARAVDTNLFASIHPKSATLDAMDRLV